MRNQNLARKIFSIVSYTNWIICINIFLFIIFIILLAIRPELSKYIVLTPGIFISLKYYWTAITSMFMHAGIFHLFVNMLSLFFLGNLTEKIIGRKRLIFLYIISGIIGSLFFVGSAYIGSAIGTETASNVFGNINLSGVGASGALFGLVGLLAVLVPHFRVFLIAGPIFLIILEVVISPFLPERIAGVFGFVITIFMLVSVMGMFSKNRVMRRIAFPIEMPLWVAPITAILPLVIVSIFVSLPIGNSAHLGGLIAGLVYGIALRLKYAKKVAMLQRMFVRRQ